MPAPIWLSGRLEMHKKGLSQARREMLHRLIIGIGPRAVLAVSLSIAAAAGAEAALPVVEVAAGVYVHFGLQEDFSRSNLGTIANIGFIRGARCVAVIDTGGSIAVGRALREAVKAVTDLPVCYVINTHVHPDHIFGNAAFKQDQPIFVGHHRLPAAMAARGQHYLNALTRDLGGITAGSAVIPPQLTVKDTWELDLGGRIVKLRAWPTAHTDNDLTVYDEQTQTLWLSDLLFIDHIPVVDGSLKGWLSVLKELQGMRPRHVIAGHGKATTAWPGAIETQQRYLDTLLRETRLAIRRKQTIQQAVDGVGYSERGKWLMFDLFHRRNVTAAFAELEWEDD